MVSEKKKLLNEISHYRYVVSCKRAEYIHNFECFETFMFRLYDKYDFNNLDSIHDIDYLDYEKLRVLCTATSCSKKDYIQSLLDLYNFYEVRKEIIAGFGFIHLCCSLEELRNCIKPSKRLYKGSKV